jgi:hypothetical protein
VLKHLAPWQFALIQKIDITLTQKELETDYRGLEDHLRRWRAKDRHEGAFIAPRFYQPVFVQDKPCQYLEEGYDTFGFGYVTGVPREELQDGTSVQLKTHDPSAEGGLAAPARAMVARPLTHVTLRLTRTDWMTWESPLDGGYRLSLDPGFGPGGGMTESSPGKRWVNAICGIPSLEQLAFVLETFGRKKDQLEAVVENAKTWVFPLDDTKTELVWDGQIKRANYSSDIRNIEPGYASKYHGYAKTIHRYDMSFNFPGLPTDWLHDDVDVEVRIIRFVRREKGRSSQL